MATLFRAVSGLYGDAGDGHITIFYLSEHINYYLLFKIECIPPACIEPFESLL